MPYIFLLCTLLLLVPTVPASAQVGDSLIYGTEALTIDLEPAYPSPGENFTAKANDYALPTQGNSIRWVVDGKPLPEGDNVRTINLTAKGSGEATVLELIVDLPSGGVSRVSKRIEPVYLDIIIEPQTRTPAFYRGRALPSIGSTINATALINGGALPSSGLIYTWRLNNQALEGGAVRANNTISFTMPRGEFATLGLNVSRPDGTTVAQRLFSIRNTAPTLAFYEVSPLYGLTTRAIVDSLTLTSASLSVRAEPYYLDLATYNNPDFLEWKIDNVINPNPSVNPYEVTIAGAGVSGSSRINFHVRNLTQVLQGTEADFRVTY